MVHDRYERVSAHLGIVLHTHGLRASVFSTDERIDFSSASLNRMRRSVANVWLHRAAVSLLPLKFTSEAPVSNSYTYKKEMVR